MKSFIFLANGFEEIEALATLDVLRRAGIDVDTVSINPDGFSTGSKGLAVKADHVIDDVDLENVDWMIMPGGMPGSSNLAACKKLTDAIVAHYDRGGRVAAICAAPAVVLAPLGVLDGHAATCYPGCEVKGVDFTGEDVVVSGRVITGRGPGLAIKFALAIVAATAGQATATDVAAGLLVK